MNNINSASNPPVCLSPSNSNFSNSSNCTVDNMCYICYNKCDTLSPCDCKTNYLHHECQIKMIKNMNSNTCNICTICKKPYNNVTKIVKNITYITKLGILLIIIFSLLISFLLSSLIVFIYFNFFTYQFVNRTIFIVLITVSSTILLLSLYFILYYKHIYRVSLIYKTKTKIFYRISKNSYTNIITVN